MHTFTGPTTLYTTLFQAYLAFASTLGEERLSHTAWTGMLAPALLDILVEANKVAGLDGAKAHRCLLRQVKLFATATRDLYRTRYLRMREIRGESRTTLHLRTPRAKHSKRAKARSLPTTAAAHMDSFRSTVVLCFASKTRNLDLLSNRNY